MNIKPPGSEPISLKEFFTLPEQEQERIAERGRQLSGIYTADLARTWHIPGSQLKKVSRKLPGTDLLYVQIDDIWKIRKKLFPERQMPGLTYKECAKLFAVPLEQVRKTPCFLGITIWVGTAKSTTDYTIPGRDVLYGYHYYWDHIRKKYPSLETP